MGLPDGWNDYRRVGNQVYGTRFIAFKVPLKEAMNVNRSVPEEKQLYPKLLVSLVPKLGLVIDLTNTLKYYNPDEFLQLGVQYQKIQVQGQKVPSYQCSVQFRDTVNKFLEENKDNDKLIGVHCTHGLNRSGFLVCRYMIEELKIPPHDAIAAFEIARGHKMERDNYLDKLKQLNHGGDLPRDSSGRGSGMQTKIPSLAVDTDNDKGTQTMRGFWLDESSIQPYHRQHVRTTMDSHIQIQRQQVNLIGCVNVRRKDLIPDGRGGYFVHVLKKEIERNETPSNWPPANVPNFRQPPPQLPPYANNSYNNSMPPYDSQPNQTYPRAPYVKRSRWSNSLPLNSNNIAEDLLRMQNMNPNHNSRGNWPKSQPNQTFYNDIM